MTTEKRKRGNPRIKEVSIATRFRPGQSGNPGGRPKTRVLAEMLAAVANQVEKKSGKTYFQLAAEALLSKAFNGDVQAFRELADRIDGRTIQPVELAGPDGKGIPVEMNLDEIQARIRVLLTKGGYSGPYPASPVATAEKSALIKS